MGFEKGNAISERFVNRLVRGACGERRLAERGRADKRDKLSPRTPSSACGWPACPRSSNLGPECDVQPQRDLILLLPAHRIGGTSSSTAPQPSTPHHLVWPAGQRCLVMPAHQSNEPQYRRIFVDLLNAALAVYANSRDSVPAVSKDFDDGLTDAWDTDEVPDQILPDRNSHELVQDIFTRLRHLKHELETVYPWRGETITQARCRILVGSGNSCAW